MRRPLFTGDRVKAGMRLRAVELGGISLRPCMPFAAGSPAAVANKIFHSASLTLAALKSRSDALARGELTFNVTVYQFFSFLNDSDTSFLSSL